MKKLLLAVVTTLALTTNSYAGWEAGTVSNVMITSWNGVTVVITRTSDGTLATSTINLTGDNLKSFIAMALTAKSTGDTVRANWAPGGWNAFEIQ